MPMQGVMPRQRLGSTVTTMTSHSGRTAHTTDFSASEPRAPFAGLPRHPSTSASVPGYQKDGNGNGNSHHSAFSFETPRRPSSPFSVAARPASPFAAARPSSPFAAAPSFTRPASPCPSSSLASNHGSPRELPSAILDLVNVGGSPHTPVQRPSGSMAQQFGSQAIDSPTPAAPNAPAAPGSGPGSGSGSFVPRLGPKKSSLTTLRSIARKTSNGTLRSVRSFYGIGTSTPTPGDAQVFETSGDAPPIPRSTSNNGTGRGWGTGTGMGMDDMEEVPTSCVPITPRRAPRSSIGPPKAQARVSPSGVAFDAPRRAPKTPESGMKEKDRDAAKDKERERAGAGSQLRNYTDMPTPTAAPATRVHARLDGGAVNANTSQLSHYSQSSMSISTAPTVATATGGKALRSMDANAIASIRDLRTAGADGRITPWGERAKERVGMGPGENELRREVLVPSSTGTCQDEKEDGAAEEKDLSLDMDAFADADEDASPAQLAGAIASNAGSRAPSRLAAAVSRMSSHRSSRSRINRHSAGSEYDNDNDMDDDLDDVITFQSYIRASVATACTTTSPRSADVSMRSMLAQIMEGDGSPTERVGAIGLTGPVGVGQRGESTAEQQGGGREQDVQGDKRSPLHVQKRKPVPAAKQVAEDQIAESAMAPRSKTPIFERFARGETPDLSASITTGTPRSGNMTASSSGTQQLVTPRQANIATTTSNHFGPSSFKGATSKGTGIHKPSESAASAMSSMIDPSFDLHHLRTSTPNSQHLGSPDSFRDLIHQDVDINAQMQMLPPRSASAASGRTLTGSPSANTAALLAASRERSQTPSPISAANAIAKAGVPLTAKQAQAAATLERAGKGGGGGGGAESVTPKPRRLLDILRTPGKGSKGAAPLRIRPKFGAGDKSAAPSMPVSEKGRMPLQPLRAFQNQGASVAVPPAPLVAKDNTYSPIASTRNKAPTPDRSRSGARSAMTYRTPAANNYAHNAHGRGPMDDEDDRPLAYGRSTTAMGFNDDRQHRFQPSRPSRPASPSADAYEPYARPATSMTHRQHRDYTFSPYGASGTASTRASPPAPAFGHEVFSSSSSSSGIAPAAQPSAHRPMVDFSRRMSDQRAFGVHPSASLSASGSGPADSSFDIATRAMDKMRAERAAAEAAAFDGGVGTAASAAKMQGGSPGYHERQGSGASLRTDESSFTAHTAGTAFTGVTVTSREGEWELERYLRPARI